MASYLDEQTAGGEVLILKAVAEQHRPGEPGVHPLHAPLPCGGETEVLPPAGQPDAAAVVRSEERRVGKEGRSRWSP